VSALGRAWDAFRAEQPPPQPSPFVIQGPAADGGFTLAAIANAPAATAEETLLAQDIAQRVAWYLATPPADRHVTADYLAVLRDIAVRALAAPDGRRDLAGQRQRFDQLYNAPAVEVPAAGPDTASTTGHDLTGSYIVDIDPDGEISIERLQHGPAPSDEQRAFIESLVALDRLMRQLYLRGFRNKDEQRRRVADTTIRLKLAGQIALEGKSCDQKLAATALSGIEADVLAVCGTKVRSHYLRDLAGWYTGTAAVSLGILVLYHLLVNSWLAPLRLQGLDITVDRLGYVAAATLAMLAGAWLSAASRIEPSSKDALEGLLAETFAYWVRATFVLGFGWFALLLLHEQVVVLSFGSSATPTDATGFKTYLALKSLAAAILTGGFLGLAERAVPASVIKRANTLGTALGG
jgi:hypothetical protein